ncbi:DUF1800 domain-containing protein [Hymenobacter setariae]|uniref:DUF1800 domain-containing protein n=1 Tax=Hymenobacter setariae TaxID=2594794 RepID=A0A558BYF6_9BACT|nr:DUF1800 domain-containing protein [Hymenobacter setariae]TVT41537.1 DUF1800 domain-containing protein [Hymenobacter setariae]
MNSQQLQHLYWRAGFGPRPADIAAGLSPAKALRQLLREAEPCTPIESPAFHYADPLGAVVAVQPVAPVSAGASMASELSPLSPRTAALPAGRPAALVLRRRDLTPEQRKQQNEGIRDAFAAMSTAWMERMATGPGQLREKMALFWHGHFACRTRRPNDSLQLLNTIRTHALGKFSDLLLAVSREPAMLQFLNNQQNKKEHPNENFAREVMELFTLGRGNYTETDVKEAARAFTGWSYDNQNNFVFRARQHDAGPKTFLGHTGNLGGEDVLAIIMQQPATATFLVTKLYRFFVNDVPNSAHIELLATAFRRSHYDIADLAERLFSADWFYDAANVGVRIKSPVELIAGLRRTLGVQLDNARLLLGYQKALGQTLFMPPNVAGWPGGRNWIDSSSLLLRLQLPAILFKNAEFAVRLKDDENDITPQTTGKERTLRNTVGARLPLAALQQLLGGASTAEQSQQLVRCLLQVPLRPENLALVQQAAAKATTPEEQLRTTLISLLSLPEYQLS